MDLTDYKNNTLKERLRIVTGVWVGHYTHISPQGQVLDAFTSRQETRIENNEWFERVTYHWPDGDAIQFDFHACFDASGETMLFDDRNFYGDIRFINDFTYVFTYFWKNKPDTRVVETVVLSTPVYKSRIWQSFENNSLVKITTIVEQLTDARPEIWYPPKLIQ